VCHHTAPSRGFEYSVDNEFANPDSDYAGAQTQWREGYGSMKSDVLREAVMARSATMILGVGYAKSDPPWNCAALMQRANKHQTNSVAQSTISVQTNAVI
jgi:hypothetical protein